MKVMPKPITHLAKHVEARAFEVAPQARPRRLTERHDRVVQLMAEAQRQDVQSLEVGELDTRSLCEGMIGSHRENERLPEQVHGFDLGALDGQGQMMRSYVPSSSARGSVTGSSSRT